MPPPASKTTFLDFEQPIAELETRIEELRFVQDDSAVDISEEIARLQKKSQVLTKEIYAKLTLFIFSICFVTATLMNKYPKIKTSATINGKI